MPAGRYARCVLCRQILNEQRRAWWRANLAALRAKRREVYWQNPEHYRQRERIKYAGQIDHERVRSLARYHASHAAQP